MTEHPEELLAGYVDGTLAPSDRAEVDAHVASCGVCREEVALARGVRDTLDALPELPVPSEVQWRLRKITAKRTFWTTRRAWVATGAAAAAAAIVGIFLVVVGPDEQRLEGQGGADTSAEDAGPPAAPAPLEVVEGEGLSGFAYPTYAETNENYDPDSLGVLARGLRRTARAALAEGFPESGGQYFRSVDLEALSQPAQTALSCVTEAAQPDETTVPFHIEAASFEDKPAYLAAFLQARSEDEPYDRIVLWVVAREDCGLLHFSFQPL